MALSSCPRCKGGFFEIKLVEPRGGKFKQNFVQCSSCGCPVGVLGFWDTGALLKDQETVLDDLEKRLKRVESYVANIDQNVVKLARTMR